MIDREPDLSLGPFSLWLTKSRYANDDDAYSRALLDFELVVETARSSIKASGEMSAGDLAVFDAELAQIHGSLTGEALLEASMSATLMSLKIRMTGLGRAEAVVEVRLPMGEEDHRILWETDQTYLEPLLRQSRALTAAFPSPFEVQPRPDQPAETPPASPLPTGWLPNILDAIFGKRADPA